MNAQVTVSEPEERGSRSFVVNLCASTTPVALAPPEDPAFASYHFFVTRRCEEGRDRYRLHMGYFASLAEARDKVEDVRGRYPTAWAGPAPLGKQAPESVVQSLPVEDGVDALANVREVLATLDMDDPDRSLLTPAQQWSLLESGKLPDPQYAVQLLWAAERVQLESLPQPALFDVYTLYHVEGTRNGLRCHGLRLGFFTDVDAAKRVASYLKPDFESVAVVPVTDAEREGASGEGPADVLRRPSSAAYRETGSPLTESTLPDINPFSPESELLPVYENVVLDGGLSAPEPFVLNLPEAPPAGRTASPGPVLDVRTRDVAPIDASVGPGRPDQRTFDVLGASALSVVEENRALGFPIQRGQAASGMSKPNDTSASAIRSMKNLAKLFSRRRA